jgi:hypothetical protein
MWASFLIPEANLPRFAEKMARIEKAAAKCGTPFAWRQVLDVKRSRPHPFRKNEVLPLVAVEVNGEAPSLAGWSLIGVLNFDLGPAIVREVPGETVPPELWDSGPECDHCQKVRQRHDTFVVRHEGGEIKRVGRQCLADFLGHDDPGDLAQLATFLMGIPDAVGEEWGEGGLANTPWVLPMPLFLSQVAALTSAWGWVSRATARDRMDGTTATADDAFHLLTCTKPVCRVCEALRKREVEPTAKHEAAAAAALAWAAGLDPKNSYEHDLKVLSGVGVTTAQTSGLAASMINAHNRVLAKAAAAEAAKAGVNNDWVGTVGKRETWTLTLTGQHEWLGDFGVTTFYRFTDAAGHRFVWASSRNVGLDIGGTYLVKGTVKRHGEYQGVKETCLSRCVPTKIETEARAA